MITAPFAIYLAAVIGIVALLRWLQRYLLIFFVAALPGTIAHELTHFLMGIVSGGKPRGFSVIPRRRGKGYVLGSVALANIRWYNGLFIGLAPLLLLPAAAYLIQWRVAGTHPVVFPNEALWAYCAATLIYGCTPSVQDLKIAAASSWWVVPGIALALVYYLH